MMTKTISANEKRYTMIVDTGSLFNRITVIGNDYHEEKIVKVYDLEETVAKMEYALRAESKDPEKILEDCGFEYQPQHHYLGNFNRGVHIGFWLNPDKTVRENNKELSDFYDKTYKNEAVS